MLQTAMEMVGGSTVFDLPIDAGSMTATNMNKVMSESIFFQELTFMTYEVPKHQECTFTLQQSSFSLLFKTFSIRKENVMQLLERT